VTEKVQYEASSYIPQRTNIKALKTNYTINMTLTSKMVVLCVCVTSKCPSLLCLHCFDTIGWVAGRAFGL